jgi:anti-sigma factor RsiW
MQDALARLRFVRDHRWSQRHMSEYIDAEMRAGETRRIERHTRVCPECRALLATLQTMISALAGLSAPPEEPVAGAVVARVHEQLAADDDQLA